MSSPTCRPRGSPPCNCFNGGHSHDHGTMGIGALFCDSKYSSNSSDFELSGLETHHTAEILTEVHPIPGPKEPHEEIFRDYENRFPALVGRQNHPHVTAVNPSSNDPPYQSPNTKGKWITREIELPDISRNSLQAGVTRKDWTLAGLPQMDPQNPGNSKGLNRNIQEISSLRKPAVDTHHFTSGLPPLIINRNKLSESGYDKYLCSKDASQDEAHVSTCRSTTSNLIVTCYDQVNKGAFNERPRVMVSFRQPTSSSDEESRSLYYQALSNLCQSHDEGQTDQSFVDSDMLIKLRNQVFPKIKRTVTVHIYDIPRSAGLRDEACKSVFESRRIQLHETLLQIYQCSTLVLAFENLVVLEHSGIDTFFKKHPKRSSLRVELRIGPIWNLPLQTPNARIAKNGMLSTAVVEKCRAELGRIDLDTKGISKYCFEGQEKLRLQLLIGMNEALGAGLVIPYGSEVDPRKRMITTQMWKKEVWTWGPD